ncbi:MAG: TadE/TadG family type IV pilus assembly protein [bacterium]|nr:TadE/TadG family type IV pilus assembly protein [bacterium]
MIRRLRTLFSARGISRAGGRERGSATLELVILTPVVLIIFSLLVGAGRVTMAGGAIEQAAGNAARAASLSRTVAEAESRVSALVSEVVTSNNLGCTPTVNINATDLSKPAGESGVVTVEVVCVVALSDLAVPGLPGSVTLTGSGRSAIDKYRSS